MERNLSVHHEILLETPIEAGDEVALILMKQDAETTRFLKTVPAEAEAVIVNSWADK
jgi:DNA polymerase I-like protein with 3'-5' exonuclease and polymerase domains